MLRLLLFAFAVGAAAPAAAHQPLETLHRDIVVENAWHRTDVTVRLPATLLFAPSAAARSHAGAPVAAPLLRAIRVGGGWDYRLDTDADPGSLAPLVHAAVAIRVGRRAARLQDIRLLHRGHQRPGSPLGEVDPAKVHISDVIVEVVFQSRRGGPVAVSFPVDRTPLPPFVSLETSVEDRRWGDRHWRVGPVLETIELSR